MSRIAGNVAREVRLAGGRADDERRDPTGRDDDVRLGRVHDGDGEGTAHDQEALANGLHQLQPLGAELLDEVRHDLGVGDGGEDMAALLEALAQFRVVLDDAVVDDRDVARAVHVRMGVDRLRGHRASPSGCVRCRR